MLTTKVDEMIKENKYKMPKSEYKNLLILIDDFGLLNDSNLMNQINEAPSYNWGQKIMMSCYLRKYA